MTPSRQLFSIRDLENLSGIKAHTIRTWEKRYDILSPGRDHNNVRMYTIENLRELMNIRLLHHHGYKISKIAQYPPERIRLMIQQITTEKSINSHAVNDFKLAMLNFDQALFLQTYETLATLRSFRDIYHDAFLPLYHEVGLLWQLGTISPVHEHFLCQLIRQKIAVNTAALQVKPAAQTDRIYVLFLPQGETHEMTLLYLQYEILFHSARTIYLGANVDMKDLKAITHFHRNITFVSYFTVEPQPGRLADYLTRFSEEVLAGSDSRLWFSGRAARHFTPSPRHPDAVHFDSLQAFSEQLAATTQIAGREQ